MGQAPSATSVTVEPDTVQTPVVVELKVTVRPDDAVALTPKGAAPRIVLSARAPKVIVWSAVPMTMSASPSVLL